MDLADVADPRPQPVLPRRPTRRRRRALVLHRKGSPEILSAFAVLASKQRPDLDRSQRLLHEQTVIIQRQEQVITALRFRHLLDNLPGEGCTGNTATAKWVNFWQDAVRTAWENRKDTSPSSPLDKLLRAQFVKVKKKSEKEQLANVLDWVTVKRAGGLYSILSQVIHGYQDGQFQIVNRQSYSPDEIAILEALIPAEGNIEDGEVVRERERERYLPAKSEDGGVIIAMPVEEVIPTAVAAPVEEVIPRAVATPVEEVVPHAVRRTSTGSRRGSGGGGGGGGEGGHKRRRWRRRWRRRSKGGGTGHGKGGGGGQSKDK